MKLFVHCDSCGDKIYLKATAKTRKELATKIGGNFKIICPSCKTSQIYNVNEVFAGTESNNTIGAAIIGGVIGLIGGPAGALSGSTIGGIIGYGADENDRLIVKRFNESLA